MQTLYQDENEKGSSREANPVDIIICTGRISGYLEEKHFREFGDKNIKIYNNREFLINLRKKFSRGNNEIMKMVELKKVE